MAFVLMGRALQIKDMLMGLDLTFWDTLLVFWYLSPGFLLIMMPVSAMLAVFLTFLRMGADKELIALKAGGISLYQMSGAPLFFGVLATLLCFWVSFSLIAVGANNFRSHILDIAQNRVNIALQPGVFNKDIPNLVFFAKKVDVQNGSLAEVMVEDTTLTILAPYGNLTVDYLKSDIVMLLKKGVIYSESDHKIIKLDFDEYIIRFSLGALFKGFDLGAIEPNEMSWNDLSAVDINKTRQRFFFSRHSSAIGFDFRSCYFLYVLCPYLSRYEFSGIQRHEPLFDNLASCLDFLCRKPLRRLFVS